MKKYWRSLDEYKNGPNDQAEKVVEAEHKNLVLDLADDRIAGANASRRDFLKLVGFSFATAAITSSCEKPVQKAIPYLIKPEEVTPGKSSYYATSFFDGTEYCSVVAKVRDGRPIKIEANDLSAVSGGGTSARVQASVLELYDQARLKSPAKGRKSATWEEIDDQVIQALSDSSGGRKVLLTSTVISPTTRKIISDLQAAYPSLEWVAYDEISSGAIREAHSRIFGQPVIPGIHFDRADYIVSFDADFLGTWLTPVEFAAGYSRKREVSKDLPEMSKHIQVETGYSITGANADERFPVSPAKMKVILASLYNDIASEMGVTGLSTPQCDFETKSIADGLISHQGTSVVISGSNDPEVQMMVTGINAMLGNYGAVLDLNRTLNVKQGNDADYKALKASIMNNDVSLLLIHNVNPVFSDPDGAALGEAISNIGLSVYMGHSFSETAKISQYVAPDHHYLEAWGDAEPVRGTFSLQQPTIHPLYNTRSFQDSLLKWNGSAQSFYDEIKAHWQESIYPLSGSSLKFTDWWNDQLQKGAFVAGGTPSFEMEPDLSVVSAKNFTKGEGLSLSLYTSVGILDGRHANNPWLQELPDPVSKICWDNYIAISLEDAAALELSDEDVVLVNGISLPVLVQPGQAKGTCSVALGYGRTVAGKVGDNLGVNAFKWVSEKDGFRNYTVEGINLEKTEETYALARTQTHNSMEERPIVRETSLEAYKKDPNAGNHFHLEAESHHGSLYPETTFDGYHWGLAIDLNKCVGCNNCVVSCIAENNIATVGKEEVKNRRIMHWMRIDRYYSEDVDNPKSYIQPVMCQHCDNAPCENVCPVAATMHSNEGLNQVAYVRCIGTKYCINNCPYRVRRFNWFKYVNNDDFNFHLNEDTARMVLNPDVTVRSRGVVEKCSFCVQRIQEKKLEAKLEGRDLEDGEVQPACVQSCPTDALVFGDLNNKESKVTRLMENERNYHLLEQLHTLPSVGYLTKVRNVEGDEDHTKDPSGHQTNSHS